MTARRHHLRSAGTISILRYVRGARLPGTPAVSKHATDGNTVRGEHTHGSRAMPRATVSAMTPPAPNPDEVMVSAHAVEQYRDRVKPGLEPDAARAELEHLRALGQVRTEPPGWVNPARPAAYYLLLGDEIVLPLAPEADAWVATTCVTKRTLTPTRRAAKSARRASLAARKRAQRRSRH